MARYVAHVLFLNDHMRCCSLFKVITLQTGIGEDIVVCFRLQTAVGINSGNLILRDMLHLLDK